MTRKRRLGFFGVMFLLVIILIYLSISKKDKEIKLVEDATIISHITDLDTDQLYFYSINESGEYFKNHGALKNWLLKNDKELIFAMNGGMYMPDLSPQGLYIENGVRKKNIDRQNKGYGNFYLSPNGVFFITENSEAFIVKTENYIENDNHQYATQSGPMLLIDGEIHQKFNEASSNLHIRNGVGILPNGNLLFAMSKKEINFFNFAQFFKRNGCQNALYLDGFVSRTYLPSKNWVQEDGKYGIIIAQIK